MQFHSPSVLQVPVRAPELELELELGTLEDPVKEGAAGSEAFGDSDGSLDALASGAGSAEAEAAAVGVLSAATEEDSEAEAVALGVLSTTAEEELEPESEPELEPELELELEPDAARPAPPKVGVPLQTGSDAGARLAGTPR
jgi:hypothetical protein